MLTLSTFQVAATKTWKRICNILGIENSNE
jgi:hypothetical protein